jgi:uncharacterized protein
MQVTKHRIVTMAIATASLVIAASVPGLAVSIESVPNPRREGGWISDGANILSPSTEATINAEIQALESATSAEVAVVTVTDTKGGAETPKRFAHDLFNTWGIGKAGKNNGVLVLIAKDDRRVEIEVGRGLTNKLTGDRIKEILDSKVTPAFKQGHYDSGAIAGTEAVIQTIQLKSGAVADTEAIEPAKATMEKSPGVVGRSGSPSAQSSEIVANAMKNVTTKVNAAANKPVVASSPSTSRSSDQNIWVTLFLLIGVPIGLISWLMGNGSDEARSRRKYSGPISSDSFSGSSDYASSSSDDSSSSDYSSSYDDSSSSDYSSSSDSGSSSDFGGGSSDSSSGGGSDW